MEYIQTSVVFLLSFLDMLLSSDVSSNRRRFLVDEAVEKPFRPLTSSCKTSLADVVFLLDTTNKEGRYYFQKQKGLVADFAKTLQIGPRNMQISVCTVSTSMFVEFSLGQYDYAPEIVLAVQKIPFRPGSSYGSMGLRSVGVYSFLNKHGDRPSVPNVLVVMTNGQSGNKFIINQESRALRDAGILMFAVGIGDNISYSGLRDFAYYPDRIVTVSDASDLPKYLNALENAICDALHTTGTTTPAPKTTTTITTQTTTNRATTNQPSLPSTSPLPCADLTACSAHGPTICGQRPDFVRVACRAYCGLCTKSGSCADNTDCASLGAKICGSSPQYARSACPAFCGFCT